MDTARVHPGELKKQGPCPGQAMACHSMALAAIGYMAWGCDNTALTAWYWHSCSVPYNGFLTSSGRAGIILVGLR
jgi:hypothetical protein